MGVLQRRARMVRWSVSSLERQLPQPHVGRPQMGLPPGALPGCSNQLEKLARQWLLEESTESRHHRQLPPGSRDPAGLPGLSTRDKIPARSSTYSPGSCGDKGSTGSSSYPPGSCCGDEGSTGSSSYSSRSSNTTRLKGTSSYSPGP